MNRCLKTEFVQTSGMVRKNNEQILTFRISVPFAKALCHAVASFGDTTGITSIQPGLNKAGVFLKLNRCSIGQYSGTKNKPGHYGPKRPRVNARLMPEAEPQRRSIKFLGWVALYAKDLSFGFGEKGVGGYEVGGFAPVSGFSKCPSCGYYAFNGVECFDCGYRS